MADQSTADDKAPPDIFRAAQARRPDLPVPESAKRRPRPIWLQVHISCHALGRFAFRRIEYRGALSMIDRATQFMVPAHYHDALWRRGDVLFASKPCSRTLTSLCWHWLSDKSGSGYPET